MGRRYLWISDDLFASLFVSGHRFYSVIKDGVPSNCKMIDAVWFWERSSLRITLESRDWEPYEGGEIQVIKPVMNAGRQGDIVHQ